MPVSPTARARARADAEAAIRAQKATYAERIARIQAAAVPPLSNAELSLGLELGELEVGRFVSTSARMANARPDGEHRALLDAVLAGAIACAVRAGPPGARREVLFLDPGEARRLDRTWTVLPLGADVGIRTDDLEDDDLWGLGVARPRTAPVRGPVVPRAFLGRPVFPIGFGTLRLGTAGRPDEADAIAVLRAALEAGVQLFDTADSYGLDEADRGYAERLLAKVGVPIVVTKAGLARPGGRWVPDGSPGRLRSGAEQSLRNLGVDALDLMLLHAVDPRVPFAESVGALARLREAGLVREVGLSNVSLAELEEARAIVPIAAVQVEISRFSPKDLTLAARCEELGVPLLAHRPLGGHARKAAAPDGAVAEAAERLGASPAQLALAWLLAAAPNLIPVVGATRPEHIRDSAQAASLVLDDDALARLDRGMPPRVHGDAVVIISGPPAAGKTSRVQAWVDRGFSRLNRDELGGTLGGIALRLREGLAAGKRRWVLDNTYGTRASREPVIAAARAAGVPARCVHVDTPQPEAFYNACLRLLGRYGRLPDPDELEHGQANDIPPSAIHRYFQTVEAPTVGEGFASVERVPFARLRDGTARAVLLDMDGTVRRTRSGAPFPRSMDDIEVLPGRREKLAALVEEGWLLRGVSNQSGVAAGDVDAATVEALFAHTAELLGVPLPVRYCPHPSGRIRCWCRKPMPGMGVAWIEAEKLDRDAIVMVGDMESDRLFAENLGVRFVWAEEFFGG